MKTSARILFAAGLLGLVGASASFGATVAAFRITGLSTDVTPLAVDATATFTLLNGVLSFTLVNNEPVSALVGDGQSITGIKFNLSNATGTAAATGTGNLVNVGSGGAITGVGGATDALTAWTVSTALPTVTITDIGSGQPTQGILPLAASTYTAANNGISAHNPFVDGTATFTLSGLTFTNADINQVISNVKLGFGTTGANYISFAVTPTPEPGSIAMCLGGLALLAAGIRKRRA